LLVVSDGDDSAKGWIFLFENPGVPLEETEKEESERQRERARAKKREKGKDRKGGRNKKKKERKRQSGTIVQVFLVVQAMYA